MEEKVNSAKELNEKDRENKDMGTSTQEFLKM